MRSRPHLRSEICSSLCSPLSSLLVTSSPRYISCIHFSALVLNMQNRNSTQNYIEPYPNFADQLPELPALSLTGLNIRLVTHRSKLGNAAGNYELDAVRRSQHTSFSWLMLNTQLMGNHLIKYHCSAWMKNNYGNITPGVVTVCIFKLFITKLICKADRGRWPGKQGKSC